MTPILEFHDIERPLLSKSDRGKSEQVEQAAQHT